MKQLLRLLLSTVCAVCLSTATAQTTQPASTGTSAFFTTSDGIKIHYLTLGDKGSWVVLLHGFGDTAERMWFRTGVASDLARNHRVVALDARNHGKSDAPQPGGSGRPEDVIELMDHLKVERAHIHGYSMGGGMTAWLLVTHPGRFVTAAFGGSGIFETDEKLAAHANAIEKPMPPPPSDPPPWLKRLLELDAVRMKTIQFAPIDLTRLAMPVLAITGEYDRPAWRTQRMWRELRDFRSVVLPGKNHLTAIGIGSPLPPEYVAHSSRSSTATIGSGLATVRGSLAEIERSSREISMVERLERRQRKAQYACGKGSAHRPVDVGRDVLFPPQCPACGAPGTRRVNLEKHCRFTVHTGDGPVEEHQTARLAVFFCSACAERHGSEMKRDACASTTETSVSRAVEYLVNPRTDLLGSRDPRGTPSVFLFRVRREVP